MPKVDKSQILRELMKYKNFTSKADFSRFLDITPQGLATWFSRNTFDINKIADKFPEVNDIWLLTGKGEMLKNNDHVSDSDDNAVSGKLVPFYDVEAAAGGNYTMDMTPTSHPVGMIEIGSILKDSEVALRVYGNSMIPNYPAGCVIGLKKHNDSFIEQGAVFVIETTDNRYLKRLYYNKGKSAFRCVSDNHMIHEHGSMKGEPFYQDFEIPFEEVRRLYRVTGVIKRNIM